MRQDQAKVTLTVDGRRIGITFSKRGGGTWDSEEEKYPPGGMEAEEALGGRQTTENVTLTGEYKPERDGDDIEFLKARRGRGLAEAIEQGLDRDGNAVGRPQPWDGILKSVSIGDYDSSGGVREVEIEVSTNGSAG